MGKWKLKRNSINQLTAGITAVKFSIGVRVTYRTGDGT